MALSSEPERTNDPAEPGGTSGLSTWGTWALVVLVGEACLVLFVILLGSVVKVGNPLAYLAAFMVATYLGGRVAGIRGLGRWLLAAVLIVIVAIALAYLLIWIVAGQMTGP